MTEDELLEGLLATFAFNDRNVALRAIRATVSAFAECLTPEESDAFARSFTNSLAERARRRMPRRADPLGAEDLYELVRKADNVPPGLAREHAQIVLRAIADRMDPELRTRLVRTLPPDLGELLRLREEGPPPEHRHPSHPPPLTTLASGRPGSRHPISEAHPDRAHSHSVAKSDHPHEETKLSSARGTTQERLGDSLSTGHPGPSRPISETDDHEGGAS